MWKLSMLANAYKSYKTNDVGEVMWLSLMDWMNARVEVQVYMLY